MNTRPALFDFSASCETIRACFSLIERAAKGEIHTGVFNRNLIKNGAPHRPCKDNPRKKWHP